MSPPGGDTPGTANTGVAADGDLCRCGCGAPVRDSSTYRPGHDARHAATIGRQLITAAHPDPVLLDQLPSPALRAKATAMLERAQIARRRVHPAGAPAGAPLPAIADVPHGAPAHTSDVTTPADTAGGLEAAGRAAGDSTEQRDAEGVMRALLADALGVPLAPSRLHLPGGSYVNLDARAEDPPVLAELWAHQGPPKGAQRNKVLADALKLHHVAAHLAVGHRKILCLADEAAATPFTTRTWYADALRTLHIEVVVVDLPDTHRTALRTAQQRQYR